MPLVPRPFPVALPHGELREVLPGLHFVTGTLAMPGPVPVRASRNMTVVKEGERLVLVNTVRLSEDGLRKLDALGKVTDVVRIAGNHGMDDPFYADRYGAKVWAVKGQRYTAGFGPKTDVYFEGQTDLDPNALPIEGAKLHVIGSKPPEGFLVLERHGGVAISGDCLQHWHRADEFFNVPARVVMRMMGFLKPHNVGPGWLKNCKPPKDELRGVGELPFDHVLTSHGDAVIGNARALYRPAIDLATR
jgi:hypothetical protein